VKTTLIHIFNILLSAIVLILLFSLSFWLNQFDILRFLFLGLPVLIGVSVLFISVIPYTLNILKKGLIGKKTVGHLSVCQNCGKFIVPLDETCLSCSFKPQTMKEKVTASRLDLENLDIEYLYQISLLIKEGSFIEDIIGNFEAQQRLEEHKGALCFLNFEDLTGTIQDFFRRVTSSSRIACRNCGSLVISVNQINCVNCKTPIEWASLDLATVACNFWLTYIENSRELEINAYFPTEKQKITLITDFCKYIASRDKNTLCSIKNLFEEINQTYSIDLQLGISRANKNMNYMTQFESTQTELLAQALAENTNYFRQIRC